MSYVIEDEGSYDMVGCFPEPGASRDELALERTIRIQREDFIRGTGAQPSRFDELRDIWG